MNKFFYFFYKLCKLLLVIFLFVFILISISYVIISKKLNYEMPSISIIELYDSDENKFLSLCNGQKQNYVKLENINDNLIKAFISLEDKRFYKHHGVDLIRIGGAFIANIKSKSYAEGASTITQQYVKNLFLNNEKKLKRKIYEAFIALVLENKYSKDEILEGYLNSIYFDHGIYGVEDASLYYFGKHAKDISLIEAASLASIPKSPVYYSPVKNPTNNEQRRKLALKEMLDDKLISIIEYQAAIDSKLNIIAKNIKTDDYFAPWFQDSVISELKKHPDIIKLSDGGIKVYTTLDRTLNKIITDSIIKRIPDSEIELSLCAMEPKTGKILAIIGGKDYQVSNYNRALNSYRQPGSTVKPFLYLSALEKGFTVATTFKSEKTTFYLGNETYSPTNFKDIYADMDISMAYALATSDNIYAMKTHLFLGVDSLAKTLKKFSISSEIPLLPSIALGTMEVNLLEMTSCYNTLANLGTKIKPTFINKVKTMDNKIVYESIKDENVIADPTDCYLLNEAMTSVFDNNMTYNIRPTCATISSMLSNKYSAKSGSTDTDNWIFGFNQDLTIGIWTGYDDNRKIENINDLRFGKYIWADCAEGYFKNKTTSWYETPDNVMKAELNPMTGFYPAINEYSKYMYFRKDNVPWYLLL